MEFFCSTQILGHNPYSFAPMQKLIKGVRMGSPKREQVAKLTLCRHLHCFLEKGIGQVSNRNITTQGLYRFQNNRLLSTNMQHSKPWT